MCDVMFLWFFCIDMVLVQVIYIYLMSKLKFFYLFVSFVKISFGLIYERFRLIFQILG